MGVSDATALSSTVAQRAVIERRRIKRLTNIHLRRFLELRLTCKGGGGGGGSVVCAAYAYFIGDCCCEVKCPGCC